MVGYSLGPLDGDGMDAEVIPLSWKEILVAAVEDFKMIKSRAVEKIVDLF